MKAWDDITTVLEASGDIQTCEIIEQIKSSPDSVVYVALINDAKVIIKKFLKEAADARVLGLKKELDFVSQKMGSGRYQVNKCLYIFPVHGIAVLSFVPGENVSALVKDADPQMRAHLISRSAKWLQKYTQPRQKIGKFGPLHWINRLKDLDTKLVMDADDQTVLARLLLALEKQAGDIAKCDVVRAAGHGDFAGVNLMYHDDVMYGVDIQTESWYALANEAARFLVYLQMHNRAILGETRFGIAQSDWHAFHQCGLVNEMEHETTLPFFIGAHLYRRMVAENERWQIRENISFAIERYLLEMEIIS